MNIHPLLKSAAVSFAALAVLFIGATVMASCEARAGGVNKPIEKIARGEGLRAFDYYTSGMHYKVIKSDDGGVFAINVTLDSLSVSELTK